MKTALAILSEIMLRALLIGGAGLLLLIAADSLAEWIQRHGLMNL